jgi:hypothetical protein
MFHGKCADEGDNRVDNMFLHGLQSLTTEIVVKVLFCQSCYVICILQDKTFKFLNILE